MKDEKVGHGFGVFIGKNIWLENFEKWKFF
jgi:hypothetical protein